MKKIIIFKQNTSKTKTFISKVTLKKKMENSNECLHLKQVSLLERFKRRRKNSIHPTSGQININHDFERKINTCAPARHPENAH